MITVTLAVVCYSTAASSYDGRVVLVSLGMTVDPPQPPPPPSPLPPSRDALRSASSTAAGGPARASEIAAELEEDGQVAHLHVETNADIQEASSELNTLLHDGEGEEAEEADAAATAAAARPLSATPPADVDVAKRVISRWRAFVAERKGALLLRLLEELRDLFFEEVLRRLDPIDRTFLAQAGSACRAAVTAASDLLRAGTREEAWEVALGQNRVWVVWHKIAEFCTSVERLAWARASGCPWGGVATFIGSDHCCAYAARGGHLEVLQWAREHGCQWNQRTCMFAAWGGHLAVLVWAREHGAPWGVSTCEAAAFGGHLEVLQWAREHHCP